MTSPLLTQALLEASHYRSFLEQAFNILKKEHAHFGYASFARKAKFASRSLPRDVINGKKITRKTLPGFVTGLGLKGNAAQYFSHLVYKEHPEESALNLSPEAITNRLQKIKERLSQELKSPTNAESVYRQIDWPDVYASLGNSPQGTSLKEIALRSAIKASECEKILQNMIEVELVQFSKETNLYRCNNEHLFFNRLGANSDFQKYFCHLMMQLSKSAQKQFNRSDALYFASTVSVKAERMEEFKSKLRELLLHFVEDIDTNNGNRLARLACAFEPN